MILFLPTIPLAIFSINSSESKYKVREEVIDRAIHTIFGYMMCVISVTPLIGPCLYYTYR